MCIQVKQLHKMFIFHLFLLGLKETLLKVLGILEVLKIFIWLLPSSNILQLPLMWLVLSFLLYHRFHFWVVLYKVQKVFLHKD